MDVGGISANYINRYGQGNDRKTFLFTTIHLSVYKNYELANSSNDPPNAFATSNVSYEANLSNRIETIPSNQDAITITIHLLYVWRVRYIIICSLNRNLSTLGSLNVRVTSNCFFTIAMCMEMSAVSLLYLKMFRNDENSAHGYWDTNGVHIFQLPLFQRMRWLFLSFLFFSYNDHWLNHPPFGKGGAICIVYYAHNLSLFPGRKSHQRSKSYSFTLSQNELIQMANWF